MELKNYKGTRDWLSEDAVLRSWIVETIREVFQLYGFEPLETPVIELKSVLFGKGGNETNRLIYSFWKGRDAIGLRFDHTVPLARVVGQHSADLTLPYRRYAIGPVFRADKPQAGRYRQFTQCDFDLVGSGNPLADAEVIAINCTTLARLGFTNQFKVHVFDRRALNGMAAAIGAKTKPQMLAVLRAWDKMGKVTREQLTREVGKAKVDKKAFNYYTDQLVEIANSNLTNERVLKKVEEVFPKNENLSEGLEVLRQILGYLEGFAIPANRVRIDPTLARGLDYYTGPIFETIIEESGIGSVTGGGRFDNLIEDLGGPSLQATGSSFGLERLVEVVRKLNIAPESKTSTQVFVPTFDPRNKDLVEYAVAIASDARHAGVNTELYVGSESIGKQLQVADRRGAQIAAFAGPDERSGNKVVLKLLRLGSASSKDKTVNQKVVSREEFVRELQKLLA